MAGILVPGDIQYKTSLAWSTASNTGVTSFTLLDKQVAICKIIHPYTIVGYSQKRVSPDGEWTSVPTLYRGDGNLTTPSLQDNSQDGVRIMRVGSTLYSKTASTFTAKGAANVYSTGQAFADDTYSWTVSLSTDTVSGAATIITGATAWDTNYDKNLTDAGWDYRLYQYARQKGTVLFANIQIFYTGY